MTAHNVLQVTNLARIFEFPQLLHLRKPWFAPGVWEIQMGAKRKQGFKVWFLEMRFARKTKR